MKMESNDSLRITTWNVNGIRNPFGYPPWRENRTFTAMFDTLEADIVIMQELKIQRKDLRDDMVLVEGWDCFFSLPKHKKGYSGVGIYTRQSKCAPVKAEEGLLGVLCPPGSSLPYCDQPDSKAIGGYLTADQLQDVDIDPLILDSEGRCVILEFPAFVLFGVYSPANSNGLRDDYRQGFFKALDARIRNLDALGKRVILTGDLNVSRNENDSAGALEDRQKDGVSHGEYISFGMRRIFNQLLLNGDVIKPRDKGRQNPILVDLCREYHPKREGMYTHWDQKLNARPGNYGSRIDYVLCSISMQLWFKEANIQEGLVGSDHCPVYAIMKGPLQIGDKEVHLEDMMNPPNMFISGVRERNWQVQDLLPFSGKLLPEFDKRQSIKDMFRKKSAQPSSRNRFLTDDMMLSSAIKESLSQMNDTGLSSTIPITPLMDGFLTTSDNQYFTKSNTNSPQKDIQSTSKRRKIASPPQRKTSNSSNQKSLMSFFQPKQTQSKDVIQQKINKDEDFYFEHSQNSISPPLLSPSPTSLRKESISSTSVNSMNNTQKLTDSSLEDSLSIQNNNIEPIDSKFEWTKIFSKRDPPRCEGHSEPCISHETKKKGANFGRRFWMCARPTGPTGTKESGTQWRCKTFIWASDV